MEAMVRGIRLHWRERGRGEPVVFLHPFPLNGEAWADQLDRLPDRWHLLAPDLRGFGRSETGEGGGPLRMDQLADDVAAFLDHRGLGRVVVCGLSMGGYVAFALWRRHRERVRALVLCDTRAEADGEAQRRARALLALRVQRDGAGAAADALLPGLLSERTRRERPELEDRVRALIESTPRATIVRALEGLAERSDSTDLLPGITVPTLVIVGAEDTVTPPSVAEAMASRIPGARLRVIEGAGHLSNMEAPAAFDTVLVHFLEATGAHAPA